MERYLRSKAPQLPQNTKERSSVRGNLRKEFMKNTMTWRVFYRGLSFINVVKLELVVVLHSVGRKHPTVHQMQVIIDDEQLDKEIIAAAISGIEICPCCKRPMPEIDNGESINATVQEGT
jgi:hypothetical protein